MAIAVVGIHFAGHVQLAQVGKARGALGGHFRARKRGQQHRRQDCNDGDDHQQLNQGKSLFAAFLHAEQSHWRRALSSVIFIFDFSLHIPRATLKFYFVIVED
jgi:hypothetical protein